MKHNPLRDGFHSVGILPSVCNCQKSLFAGLSALMAADPNTLSLAYGAISGAATSGLVIYLAKKFFEASVIKRITGNIEHDLNKKLAKYESELQSSLQQQQTIHSYSFPKTAETIDALNKKLFDLYNAVIHYVNENQASESERVVAMQNLNQIGLDIDKYFFTNQIYLPPALVKKIYEVLWDMRMLRSASEILRTAKSYGKIPETVNKQHEKMDELTDIIPKRLADIRSDFQTILRTDDKKSAP